mgnify:CR=1 FL=1
MGGELRRGPQPRLAGVCWAGGLFRRGAQLLGESQLFFSFEFTDFAQKDGGWAKAGKGLLKQIRTHKNRKPHKAGVYPMGKGNTE